MRSVTRSASRTRPARREEVLATLGPALEELLGRGQSYTELSVERIATAAGISRSGFYSLFEDKLALLEELAADVVRGRTAVARGIWDLPPDAGREDVAAALHAFFESCRPHAGLLGAVTETSGYDARMRDAYVAMVEESAGALADHIRRGQDAGWVVGGIDPERTARWIGWMAERGAQLVVLPADPAAARAESDALAEIVWRTLYSGVRDV